MSKRLVYGLRPVEEALSRGGKHPPYLLVAEGRLGGADGRRIQEVVKRAEGSGVTVQRCSRNLLDDLCGGQNHQGILALVGDFPYLSLGELLDGIQGPPLLLVVDSVTDPQNLGAMFRSALLFGAHGVILPKDRCADVNSTVVRVSSGATEHLPVARVTNLSRAVDELKEAGIWVAATVESGGSSPAQADMRGPFAMVLGSEYRGVRPLVRKKCDLLLTINSQGPIASLNVAAATAVLFYEAARQRGGGKKRG